MGYKSKIRMSLGWIYPIVIFTSYILAIIEWSVRAHLIRNGTEVNQVPFITYFIVALLFIVLGIIQWFRYRNWIYPVLGFIFGLTISQGGFAFSTDNDFFWITYFICFIILVLFVILNWSSLYGHERFELNSRRLFRLAAERIYETSDGYTERPYSAGTVKYTRDELLGLARYLYAKCITRPFYLEDCICLAFSMNKSLIVVEEPSEVSNIILDHNGNLNVKISEKDYRDYRERLSFDQLCSSMANVFIRFLDYYKNGLESRIITELKSAK
jgi:hypothetical protein